MTTLLQSDTSNYTPGRPGNIDRIVMHWAVGTTASTNAVFASTAAQTSAHYMIEDDTRTQYVDEGDIAWHAGNSAMNARSIGIEHSAAPDRPASNETIENSSHLVADICKRYDIPCDREHIIKHSEVPYPTQCCGTLPVDLIVEKANQILKREEMVSEKGVNYLFKVLLGRECEPVQREELMKVHTFDSLEEWIRALPEFTDKVARAAKGSFDLNSLIVHPYSDYVSEKSPAPDSSFTEVTEKLYRKK